ncbi:MAG: hypothetical protein HC836_10505 [Richelia sp. RM2_1_2]|nr:hypothetical protein [Richelia sp. RM2_1_2]
MRVLTPIAVSLILLAAGGCTTAQRGFDGNGNPIVSVACIDNQTMGGMTSCMAEVMKVCPAGYKFVGSTNHPLAWQITEPKPGHVVPTTPPGMPNGTGVDEPPSSIALYNMGYYNPGMNNPGGYGWSPRITQNRGNYQYITVTCN